MLYKHIDGNDLNSALCTLAHMTAHKTRYFAHIIYVSSAEPQSHLRGRQVQHSAEEPISNFAIYDPVRKTLFWRVWFFLFF